MQATPLYLVDSAAAGSSQHSVEFFALEQQLYNSCQSSTKRWVTLLSHYEKDSLTLKALSKTRRSARADASKVMCKGYKPIISALLEISVAEEDSKKTQLEAKKLAEKLQSLETTLMIYFWSEVLTKFEDVSGKNVQGENLDLDRTAVLYETLESSLTALRNEEEFSNFESKANEMCGSGVYKKDKARKKKLKVPYGESKEGHTEFDGRNSFNINYYYSAIDTLKSPDEKESSLFATERFFRIFMEFE